MHRIRAWGVHSSRASPRSSRVAGKTGLSVVAILGSLVLASACVRDAAGPGSLPSCAGHGTQLTLAVAEFASLDPAADSGCVTFPANASADTAEYLVLPWSTGGGAGTSTPF